MVCNSLQNSSLPDSPDTREKKIRNNIYLGCGIGIAVAAGVLIAGNVFNLKQYIPNFIWIAEVVAQIAYAIAWFTKSGRLIKDKDLSSN